MEPLLHVALFPFMAKGHTIPLLQLVKLIHIHRSHAIFTIFTTPANRPFIVSSLSDLPNHLINIVTLPFPALDEGVESGDVDVEVLKSKGVESNTDDGQLLKEVEDDTVVGQLPPEELILPKGVESDSVDQLPSISPLLSKRIESNTVDQHSFEELLPKEVENNIVSQLSLEELLSVSLLKGVESVDQLPSMLLFFSFLEILEKLQPEFETELKTLQEQEHPITCLVSDGFLHWTQESASKFNIPRLGFYGMNNYSFVLSIIAHWTRPFLQVESLDQEVTLPDLPWVRVTRDDFGYPLGDQDPQGPGIEYMNKCGISMTNSYGMLANSFYELESKYVDLWNSKFQPKVWCIGPLCLAEKTLMGRVDNQPKPNWKDWLDAKWAKQRPVLYVAFGSQGDISNEQLKEIMIGLEKSSVDFIWALRVKPNQEEVVNGLEERVKGRGLIEKGWLDQRNILGHEAIQGFLSHCGWNSIMESVCERVPVLAFPIGAEQHLNAKMVAEEMKVGLRVTTCSGSVRGLVKWEDLSKDISELIVGEEGKIVRENVEKLAEEAKKSFQIGGSSWNYLETLLSELEILQQK